MKKIAGINFGRAFQGAKHRWEVYNRIPGFDRAQATNTMFGALVGGGIGNATTLPAMQREWNENYKADYEKVRKERGFMAAQAMAEAFVDQFKEENRASILKRTLGGAAIGGLTGFARNPIKLEKDYRKMFPGGAPKDIFQAAKEAFKNKFNVDISKFKTKDEFNKAYRGASKKYHPDINKSPDAQSKMQDLSNMADAIRKSEWFEKLAKLTIEGMFK